MSDVGAKQKTGLVLLTLASAQFLMTLDTSDRLKVALAALALIALIGLFFSTRIPGGAAGIVAATRPPGEPSVDEPGPMRDG